MIVHSRDILKLLVESNPKEGDILSDDQRVWLDQALYWEEVEKEYGLEVDILECMYEGLEPMNLHVLEILWELNGSGPQETSTEEDIWI